MVKKVFRKTYDDVTEIIYLLSKIGLFALGVFIAFSIYKTLVQDIVSNDKIIIPFITLWILTAYIVLPRVHRLLTKLYIPNYFIGRTRTGDGIFGDPVNLAFNGSEKQLRQAMLKAGWIEADDLNISNSIKAVKAFIFRRSYPSAPVSSLYLFSRKQDLAFQQEEGGSTHTRHHVRFWRTPKKWYLPGGYKADWLGAATYDRAVGFSFFTLQITHRIAEDTDIERDFVIESVQKAGEVKELNIVKNFTTGYHSRNGGGDRIQTDGSMPFVTLK